MTKLPIWKSRRVKAAFPYALLLVPPLCWGGNAVLARGVVDILPPVSFAFWRWCIAFAILFPFARNSLKKDCTVMLKSWKIILLFSFFGIGCFNTLLYRAAHTTTAINISLIQTIMPAMIILISRIFFKESIRGLQLVGVILCIVGASLIALKGKWQTLITMSFTEGDLLLLLAVFSYALYSAFLRKRPAVNPLSFLTIIFGVGALMLLPLYIMELLLSGFFPLRYAAILSILFVALFPSIIAYFCWNRGIEEIGANKAGLFMNLTPVFATIMAIIFLGESIQTFHITGMAFIFGGMVIFNRRG
jgi:drug/metabolite transporter (DMT)-like permease